MPQYLISFGAGAMDHIPEADMPDIAAAAHDVVRQIWAAGEYVCAGGLEDASALVSPDGSAADGPPPHAVSGLTVVEVASHEQALAWAAKIAAACRCTQEVRAIGPDFELEEMLRPSGG